MKRESVYHDRLLELDWPEQVKIYPNSFQIMILVGCPGCERIFLKRRDFVRSGHTRSCGKCAKQKKVYG